MHTGTGKQSLTCLKLAIAIQCLNLAYRNVIYFFIIAMAKKSHFTIFVIKRNIISLNMDYILPCHVIKFLPKYS